jgi:hypothetical protein
VDPGKKNLKLRRSIPGWASPRPQARKTARPHRKRLASGKITLNDCGQGMSTKPASGYWVISMCKPEIVVGSGFLPVSFCRLRTGQ